MDDKVFEKVNAFIAAYKTVEFPVLENVDGDHLIKPSYRRKMKKEFQEALIADLNDALEDMDAEVLLTPEGIIIAAPNDYEGVYTIQVDTKFKNLDYDPYCDFDED